MWYSKRKQLRMKRKNNTESNTMKVKMKEKVNQITKDISTSMMYQLMKKLNNNSKKIWVVIKWKCQKINMKKWISISEIQRTMHIIHLII